MSSRTINPAPFDRPAKLTLGVVAIPLALWNIAGITVALAPGLVNGTERAWMLGVFELISAVSAAILIGLAFGRFKEGPAITSAFAALAVFVGALLGSVSSNNVLGDLELAPFVVARLIVAAIIGLAALMLTIRSLGALSRLIIGSALVVPVMAALGLFVLGRLNSVLDSFGSLHPALGLSLAILAGFAAVAAVAGGGHLVIAAFEVRPSPAKEKPEASQ